MNKREIIKKTIAHEPTEYVPYSFDMTSKISEAVYKWLSDSGRLAEDGFIGDYFQFVGAGNPAGYAGENAGENRYKDEFGCVWNHDPKTREIGDCGNLYKPALDAPSLDGYVFPVGAAPGRFDHLDERLVTVGGKYVVLGVTGIFDIGWHLRGFENFLGDLADSENTFAEEVLELGAEYVCGVLSSAPPYIDGVRFGEDWGLQKGLMMAPSLWRKLLKPRLKRMYEAASGKGFDVLVHTCGDISEIIPDLAEIGVQVVNPMQPEVMDIHKIKREYGKYLSFYGGMGCQSTIPFGTVQNVADEVADRVKTIGKGGGYILGPAGAIPRDAKLENVFKLVELCMDGQKQF
ncbi:MAG: hypothetical protein FWD23_01375 [Oscillospiraceae bacterium]|nr:hypothetical protein [Oscillospiraceae bacterium]